MPVYNWNLFIQTNILVSDSFTSGETNVPELDHQLIPIKKFARSVERTTQGILKWKNEGRLNRFTGQRVFCQMTMTTQGFAISQAQYRQFLDDLNQRP